MIVWPVSMSVCFWKVGSSSDELLDGVGQLVLVGLGLRLDGDVDDGLGEVERLQHDRRVDVAERVARGGLLQAHRGDDVAGEDGHLVLAVVGVHLQQPADALLAVLGGVQRPRRPS